VTILTLKSKLNLLINETPKIGFFCPTLGVHFKTSQIYTVVSII